MKHFIAFSAFNILLKMALALPQGNSLPNYPNPTPNMPPFPPGHGSDPKCTFVDEVEYTEKCEQYIGKEYLRIKGFKGIIFSKKMYFNFRFDSKLSAISKNLKFIDRRILRTQI